MLPIIFDCLEIKTILVIFVMDQSIYTNNHIREEYTPSVKRKVFQIQKQKQLEDLIKSLSDLAGAPQHHSKPPNQLRTYQSIRTDESTRFPSDQNDWFIWLILRTCIPPRRSYRRKGEFYLVSSTAVLLSLPNCIRVSSTCWTISDLEYAAASPPSFAICSLIHM